MNKARVFAALLVIGAVSAPGGAHAAPGDTTVFRAPYAGLTTLHAGSSDPTPIGGTSSRADGSAERGNVSVEASAHSPTRANANGIALVELPPLQTTAAAVVVTAKIHGSAEGSVRAAGSADAEVSAFIVPQEGVAQAEWEAAEPVYVVTSVIPGRAQVGRSGSWSTTFNGDLTEDGFCAPSPTSVELVVWFEATSDATAGSAQASADLVLDSVTIEELPCDPQPAQKNVEVQDFQFSPSDLTVPVGTTVKWNWTGDFTHTVTATDGSFDSGAQSTGDGFGQFFDTPGTYAYYCQFHGGPDGSGMAGTITVE